MSLLLSLQSDMIKFLWFINMLAILYRIYLINFFCIFFISLLFIILIMTSLLLWSDDKLSLRCCSFVVVSFLVTFTHDMIFIERCVLLYVCNCLLSSWIDVFNFCTFFVMNMFWFTWSFAICKEWQWQILALLAINISNIHLISCLRFASLLAETYS